MPRLLLVRHGQTSHNVEQRFTGSSDIELNETGLVQVEKLGERLREESIDIVFSSDLKRAMSTAEAVCCHKGLTIIPCPELRELNYGIIEGMTWEDIKEHHPEMADFHQRFDEGWAFPGGEGLRDMYERTAGFMDRFESWPDDYTILITCHGGVLRTLVCQLLDIEHHHWHKFHFDNASLTVIDTTVHGSLLRLLNDTSHLAETADIIRA